MTQDEPYKITSSTIVFSTLALRENPPDPTGTQAATEPDHYNSGRIPDVITNGYPDSEVAEMDWNDLENPPQNNADRNEPELDKWTALEERTQTATSHMPHTPSTPTQQAQREVTHTVRTAPNHAESPTEGKNAEPRITTERPGEIINISDSDGDLEDWERDNP